MERLQKFMAECGVASRRKCEDIIKEGRVTVNGETVTEMGAKVEPEDIVTVDGKSISVPKRLYIMLNKPDSVISSSSDPEGRKTVIECVPVSQRLYPVGRLDYHTEGLILLTDDGDAAYRLTHPKYEIEKEYIVVIKGSLSRQEALKLEGGVILDDGVRTSPAKIGFLDVTEHTVTVSVTIREGKNREVRRMMETIGKEVLSLKRVRMGGILLGNLKPGEYRELNSVELAYLSSLK